MRFVKRSPDPPLALNALDRNDLTELDRAKKHLANPDPKKGSFKYAAYKHAEVKQRLETMFHGKCAYCETFYASSAPVDIEHYRPKNAVSESPKHPGYWWMAMAWENLLPSCIDCNRKRGQNIAEISTSLTQLAEFGKVQGIRADQVGKKDSFPITDENSRISEERYEFDSEIALLINPTVEDPLEYLKFHIDFESPLGLVIPKTDSEPEEKGAVSIQVYGLNRLKLVQDRTRLLRQLEFLGNLVIELSAMIDDLEEPEVVQKLKETKVSNLSLRLALMKDMTLSQIKKMSEVDAPYSAMVCAWIDRFEIRLLESN